MATEKQRAAGRHNIEKARKRKGGTTPRTRSELDEGAKKRTIKGRPKMGRAELDAALRRG